MPWIQVILETDQSVYEQAEQALLDTGALSVTFKDAEDNPVLEPAPGETPLWDTLVLTGLYEADIDTGALRQQLQQQLGNHPVKIEALEDRDWVRAWMDSYKPMQFGQRLWVCPRHLSPPEPDAVNLMLDPGLAFGTGTHPTTALCLQWLDQNNIDDRQVLDYGCGSGVLAIAALLLGANHCDAVDIDPQALEATQNNAKDNQVLNRLDIMLPEKLSTQQYDIVLANILAGPLVELAPVLAGFTRHGGQIALSGILNTQSDEIIATYSKWFKLDDKVVSEDWVRITGVKI
ncbi:MAG: 50S ribosomal protein L11 methyltransferase [Gammaproteobacteria bacterium]|nr:50S ribosomal protein L11 methyltransferase [Gammaproteobacteria bacterium]